MRTSSHHHLHHHNHYHYHLHHHNHHYNNYHHYYHHHHHFHHHHRNYYYHHHYYHLIIIIIIFIIKIIIIIIITIIAIIIIISIIVYHFAKRAVLIAGDWNSELESITGNINAAVGSYANEESNARGCWFQRWATLEKLVIANTLFKKRWGRRWSHTQKGRKRVIDYICVDRRLRKHLVLWTQKRVTALILV